MKVIGIGCDHAGVDYKDLISQKLTDLGYIINDHGCYSSDSIDYPDFIHPVAESVESGFASLGIILCGSGNGAAITANKHQGIRASLCWSVELAELARLHNDANILAIPARFVDEQMALDMVDIFLKTKFEGGRHLRRVEKIALKE